MWSPKKIDHKSHGSAARWTNKICFEDSSHITSNVCKSECDKILYICQGKKSPNTVKAVFSGQSGYHQNVITLNKTNLHLFANTETLNRLL